MDEQTPPLGSGNPPPFHAPPPPPAPPPPLAPAAPPVIPSIKLPPGPPSRGSGWKVLAIILMVLLGLMVVGRVATRVLAVRALKGADENHTLEEVVVERAKTEDKIAVVEVSGVITSGEEDRSGMSMVDFIKEEFKAAASDSDVKAVILKVNSPGGEVLASDDIYNIIKKFQEKSAKPVIVSMGALAASGGYYISSPCRWIVANELTITGSIGVIMHNYNYRNLMDKVGIRPEVIKSGRFKDMLSGEKNPDTDKLTPDEQKDRAEEEQMVQTLINETYDKFKAVVKAGRGWAASQNGGEGKPLANNWQDYADGRILSGKGALDLGLVDELGDFDAAVKRAETLTGLKSAELVEYHLPVDFASMLSRILGKSQPPAIKVDLGFDLPKLQAGLLYFMTPTVVPH